MAKQLPVGWEHGTCERTRKPCFINSYTEISQWEYPTTTGIQSVIQEEIQELQNVHKKEVHELQREIRGSKLQLQQEQEVNQKKIQKLQDYSERQFNSLQQEINALHLQLQTLLQPSPSTLSISSIKSSQGLQPPSRQPSSYKKPQPRTCERCSTEFPSGQALFRHLPDCQPFRCTKCSSTFQSNTILYKHIRGCRRIGPKEVFTGEN